MRFFKNKLAVTILVLSVTFLVLIGYSFKRESKGAIENGVAVALNPVQKVFYGMNDNVKGFLNFVFSFSDVKKENEELKKKNSELESKSIEYDSLKNENERLRAMLDFKSQRADYNYIGAHIINKTGGSILESFTIDRGEKDGLQVGMVAISPIGLVGQVTYVANSWASVQPIINENIAVGALVESTRETTGIVKGYRDSNNKFSAKVYYIDMNSEIKEGDVILTAGLGDFYPKEIKIGEVISVEEDKGKVSKTATIRPYVDFNKLEELYLVVPTDKKNIKY
ncbi:rod shape-determining protein MreC [Clostridium amazonitimonense]|uniref:rod shape-determining protein MreC n=1 Tax=Clostridium amazonitimonense TaxID=1499689 RepID=UPI0005096612|nr:rod shape-determining protein MreC [Clostridium amazonitimonense]